MMDMYMCLVIFNILFSGVKTFILPPIIEHGPPPDCTSYSSLCHLSYGYFDDQDNPLDMLQSSSPICKCQGNNTCAVDWEDKNNTIEKALPALGNLTMQVKMSYCELPKVKRDCRFDEDVLVTRGRGPLSFEIVRDLECTCKRPLFPHNSWSEGPYDYVEYSCGKPRCSVLGTKVCSLVQYKGLGDYEQEYYCRCGAKRREICTGVQPNENRTIAYHWCTRQTSDMHF